MSFRTLTAHDLLVWLVMAALVAPPLLASIVCWFRSAPMSPRARFFAGAHGTLFVAALPLSHYLSPVSARELVLPLFFCFAALLLVALTSAITAFVLHRRSVLALVLLVIALPIEAYLSVATLGTVLGINLQRMGAP